MGGKGKKGFKGGRSFGGFGPQGGGKGLLQVPHTPVLEAPPLYNKAPMNHVPRACELRGQQEADLITSHRRLLHFWKTSPYFIHEADKSRRWRLKSTAPNAEDQLLAIVKAGGMSSNYFPMELQTRSLLRSKGKAAEKQVLEALKRMEGKEGTDPDKKPVAKKDSDGEGHMEDDDVDDEIFGDDDDLAGYHDFEDGMGNDFEDAGGDGDADF